MLNAGANISKAFWGSGGKFAAERKPLRDNIGLGDNSPLRQVTMRNNFEHFDERLDRWWQESKGHSFVDSNVAGGFEGVAVEDIDVFRNYNPKTKELTFWGQAFNLQALAKRIRTLLESVRRAG